MTTATSLLAMAETRTFPAAVATTSAAVEVMAETLIPMRITRTELKISHLDTHPRPTTTTPHMAGRSHLMTTMARPTMPRTEALPIAIVPMTLMGRQGTTTITLTVATSRPTMTMARQETTPTAAASAIVTTLTDRTTTTLLAEGIDLTTTIPTTTDRPRTIMVAPKTTASEVPTRTGPQTTPLMATTAFPRITIATEVILHLWAEIRVPTIPFSANDNSYGSNNSSEDSSSNRAGPGGDWVDKGVSFAAQKAGLNLVRHLAM